MASPDGVAGPVTLTLGADFTGVHSPRPASRHHGRHATASPAAGSAAPATTAPAGQQATVPGQSAGVETRNGAQNICTAMPNSNPNVGGP